MNTRPPRIELKQDHRPRPARTWRAPRFGVFSSAGYLVGLAACAAAVYPLVELVRNLFASRSSAWGGLQHGELSSLILDTAAVVLISGALALIVGTTLAWVNTRTDAALGFVGNVLPVAPFLLPSIAGAIGWFFLLAPTAGYLNYWTRQLLDHVGIHLSSGPFDIYSWPGLVFLYMIFHVPYVYLIVSAALRNLDGAIDEQSRVCGYGPVRTLFKVTLPSIRPSLGSASLMLIWTGVSMYSVPAVISAGMNVHIMSVEVVQLLTNYPPRTGTAVALSMLMIGIVGAAAYGQFRIVRTNAYAKVAGKGAAVRRVALGRWRYVVRAGVCVYLFVSVVFPVAALALVALNRFWTPQIRFLHLSFAAFQSAFEDQTLSQAIRNSVMLAAVGASIAIAIAVILALTVTRVDSRPGRLVDQIVRLPAILPHVVVAVGIILAFAGPPWSLGGTLTILLLAYVIVWTPQASVVVMAAVGQVGNELGEASRVAGASEGRTALRIFVPLMGPALAAGWILTFVHIVGDLNVSVLLAGTNSPVVGSQILSIYEDGSYADLAVLALVLTAITVVAVSVVLALGARRSSNRIGKGVSRHG